MASLTLKQVSKSFGRVEVLRGVDLSIDDGEFVVFVGPSGCGKSTLLRIIAGLETESEGDIAIAGEVVNHVAPAKRGIAMVFQTYALYPHLTVEGNMSLGLKQAGLARGLITERIAFAARMLELADLLKRRPAELSGGQRQRVAIGRALVREPRIFLFDEPLSNLDAGLRIQTRLEIARLHRELSATIVYVTHDQVEAMTLADRIVVLNEGRIEQQGRPMDLYNDPDNLFVASFLGSPAINIVPGKLLGIENAAQVGIRPEYLSLASDGRSGGKGKPGSAGGLTGEATHVEQLGADTNVYVRLPGGALITARLFGQRSAEVGSGVTLAYDEAHLLRFDDSGARLR